MTHAELNEVRDLKKKIEDEKKRLAAIKIVLESQPHKYGRSEDDLPGQTNLFPKSPFESLIVLSRDTEDKIERLQSRLNEAIPELTKKIRAEFPDADEQTLLIYRYVAGYDFKLIAPLLNYSESRVYQMRKEILERLQSIAVDCS